MAPLILLLFLLSEAASDLIVVTVYPGDDVILSCQTADSSIRVVKWTRPDLEPDIVLLYRDGHLNTDDQHPSFKDRVELVDRDLKDGDMSLILKNVNRHDAGTYECGVKTGDSGRTKRDTDSDLIRIIRTVRLQVTDLIEVTVHPGDDFILPCRADDSSISAVEWTRPDLEPDNVFLYSDGHLNTDEQHPSFKDRVELVDRDLKDGDVSLILKNVNINDTGTYKCRVKTRDSGRTKREINSDQIRTVRLQVTDLIVVRVPGDDVILPCQAANSSIRAVEWTRPDLKPDIVLLYRDGHLNTDEQHPDFKDRVELVDRDLKDRDVSLILKNVNINDTGTYKCRVKTRDSGRTKREINSDQIRTVRLQVPDLIEVTVHPGDDFILPCRADDSSIRVVEWTRPDLEPDTVFLYSDGHLNTDDQNPSFKDRVELVDRDLKDGDVSLILKKVNINDAGTYNCRVKTNDTDPIRTIRTVRLQVTDLIEVTVRPGDDVILPCRADDSSIRVVEWTRADLEPDTVLLYSDGHLNTDDQNPSFKNRVELVDRDLKDGDVSLTLKNVNINDAGTYKCRVKTGDTDPIRTIRTVRLQVPDLIEVTVHPGDDFILPCRADDSSISAVEWTRPDLEPDIVLLYSDGHLNTDDQHPSFKDRVELVDRDLKDGDVSLILKNVSSIDAGTYECRVKTNDTDPIRTIRTVRLQVIESDLIEVTVRPGDDFILPCQADDSSIRVVKWTRPDLEPDTVFLYRDGHLNTTDQHPSFKDRVELVDRALKDRDASLILKKVNINDTGTYKCRVKTGDTDPIRTIRTVRLQVTDLIEVTVRPGDDVILPCRADDSSIRALEWTRADLKPDTVLLYRDGHLNTDDQNPSFKDRVELVDRELKDGDVSLTLKNVNINDAGTYKCRVKTRDTDPIRLIRTVRVQVTDLIVVTVHPGDDVILPCRADDSSISVVEWTRPDLEPDIVLLYSDGHLNTDDQNPSFKDRVKLVDRDLKDGDVSLTLKNVNINDAGTYKCRVKTRDTDPIRLIRTVRVQVTDLNVVKEPGDDVILSCQAAKSNIRDVEWTRPDLKPDIVFLYRDGHLNTDKQHPSFKDRVELVDRDLKDGDVSLILKNVNKHDDGIYECRVKTRVSGRTKRDTDSDQIKPITAIRLQVPDLIEVTVPGDDAILPCKAADSSIRAVKWTRADLKSQYVFLNIDRHLNTTYQHPDFKDRVELMDRDLKDGNVSLILKNVSRIDNGTYVCGVKTVGSGRTKREINSDPIRPIRIIHLLVPDQIVVVQPGDDVILPCQAPDSSIRAVEWRRPDLKPNTVLLYSDGHLYSKDQNTQFKNRVDLVDRDLKGRDVSLILKNVSRHDTGTYKCGVKTGDSTRTKRDTNSDQIIIIKTIRLQVTGSEDRNSSPGGRYLGLIAALVVGLFLVGAVVAVVGFRKYKRRKDMRSGPPAAVDDDEASADKFL